MEVLKCRQTAYQTLPRLRARRSEKKPARFLPLLLLLLRLCVFASCHVQSGKTENKHQGRFVVVVVVVVVFVVFSDCCIVLSSGIHSVLFLDPARLPSVSHLPRSVSPGLACAVRSSVPAPSVSTPVMLKAK